MGPSIHDDRDRVLESGEKQAVKQIGSSAHFSHFAPPGTHFESSSDSHVQGPVRNRKQGSDSFKQCGQRHPTPRDLRDPTRIESSREWSDVRTSGKAPRLSGIMGALRETEHAAGAEGQNDGDGTHVK